MKNFPYEDIVALPHPDSTKHPRMPHASRAAQFAPFAALTGYEDVIRETERITDPKADLDESEKRRINEQLLLLQAVLSTHPVVSVTHFLPDSRKDGGSYQTDHGRLTKIDPEKRLLFLDSGRSVLIDQIRSIESELFSGTL